MTLVVFDFDKTILDCNSDTWVIKELGFNDLFYNLRRTLPWNALMDRMISELHSRGKTIDDIVEVLKRAPIHPRVLRAIKTSHALRCDLRIVSDANLFFIETILEYHGILDCFTEVYTNPGFVDGEGRLRISPYHDAKEVPHGCDLCPPNMCKGLILQKIQAATATEGDNKKRIIYLGDGSGDYCPSLKLRERDFVMPRMNFPMWKLICQNPTQIRAKVCEWNDGEALELVLSKIIEAVLAEEREVEDSSPSSAKSDRLSVSTTSFTSSRDRLSVSTTSFTSSRKC